MTAWLFPGQGSQYVGMLAEWRANAEAALDALVEASEVLDIDLAGLIAEGPADVLADTYNQQPALLASSIAILRGIGDALPHPDFVAGHSLGEYSALVASGALSFEDGLRLVRERGRLMRHAGERNPGGMAAVLGLPDEVVEDTCRAIDGVQVANYNSPGQIVISGTREGVRTAIERLEAAGAKRIVELPITIAAHSSLMNLVASDFDEAVRAAPIGDSKVPLVANVTADALSDAKAIRSELSGQLTAPVRWADGVRFMMDRGVRRFYEVGPGTVLTGLVRRIAKHEGIDGVEVQSLDQP